MLSLRRFVLLVAEEVFEELAYYAEAFFGLGELCGGG